MPNVVESDQKKTQDLNPWANFFTALSKFGQFGQKWGFLQFPPSLEASQFKMLFLLALTLLIPYYVPKVVQYTPELCVLTHLFEN